MTTTSADELLKGCNKVLCGTRLENEIFYCLQCKAKIAQSLAEKKGFLGFLQCRQMDEVINLADLGSSHEKWEYLEKKKERLKKEIKKLEEASSK